MKTLIDIIAIALFSTWLLGWFTPINSIRDRVVTKLVDTIVKFNMLWAQPLLAVFMCPKCLSFWASLLYFQNLSYALITSFLATIIHYTLKQIGDVES